MRRGGLIQKAAMVLIPPANAHPPLPCGNKIAIWNIWKQNTLVGDFKKRTATK